ncbi:transcription factor [Paracoccidioides lutzii Pb01]|uniref:transcription factor n=1 Tax=Paracoccidioides lutzii (strain ATCC MYA-826 / Pb01) TaxID=502779 RepID=UPI00052B12B7|nr:transcription factor [Paracoccidioides lutzii Pb01]EEH38109.2 transcription factor [Paracoccidioides lutzii Pb01]
MTSSVRNGSPSPSPALPSTTTPAEQESRNAMTMANNPGDWDSSESRPQSLSNGKGIGNGMVANGHQKPSTSSTAASANNASAKDPLRPRRKKAKRACFACQRAHLTCGDERPCQRCIKRGLQDTCHDGVRKKAKYLHDAPNEALIPGIRGNLYNQAQAARNKVNSNSQQRNGTNSNSDNNSTNTNSNNKPSHQDVSTNFFSTPSANNYHNVYTQAKSRQSQHMPSRVMQDATMNPSAFQAQPPASPTFDLSSNPQNHTLSPSIAQNSGTTPSSSASQNPDPYGSTFFDPSHPALFNFDIASMNFGNRYGALEFGMLGHLATGAGDTPPSDTATRRGSIGRSSGTFTVQNFGEGSSNQSPFLFGGDPVLNDWNPAGQGPTNPRNIYNQNSVSGQMTDHPHAFAIESAPMNFASPTSTESPQMTTVTQFDDPSVNFSSRTTLMPPTNTQHQQQPQPPRISTPSLKNMQVGVKRRYRSPSSIYESVKEPYSYTSGFHSLTAFIQRRFSPQKTLQIAKALASIRPSFIATTKTLNQDDLIFMEKCFQRTLWEYEDFIDACGTPTIVCRRTGEIAAVGKEFSILTGWKKEVLLGKEPNLNVNTGGSSSSGVSSRGSSTYNSRNSATTTVMDNQSLPAGRTQPVFLAELLDDDSVIEFYEDFAKLAFGDSRGSVMTTCKLLKYKTKEDGVGLFRNSNGEVSAGGGDTDANDSAGAGVGDGTTTAVNGVSNGSSNNATNVNANGNVNVIPNDLSGASSMKSSPKQAWGKSRIAGEAGMNQLGFRDGKVECSYCWTVKRDVFDIPMLIVMNDCPTNKFIRFDIVPTLHLTEGIKSAVLDVY